MTAVVRNQTVGRIVANNPSLARAFEELGIDYCCGGRVSLEDACRILSLDVDRVIAQLNESAASGARPDVDPMAMSLTELADHIESTHHGYLKTELPRLEALSQKVASAHGGREPNLFRIHSTMEGLHMEMVSHMMKEERVLFPMIRLLEAQDELSNSHSGSITDLIRQMEAEHAEAGADLDTLHEITSGFVPPEWACNSYRALLYGLKTLEQDMHIHVHKENNVMFPRAIELESTKRKGLD